MFRVVNGIITRIHLLSFFCMSKKLVAALSFALVLGACSTQADLTTDGEVIIDDEVIMDDEIMMDESSSSSSSEDEAAVDAEAEVSL